MKRKERKRSLFGRIMAGAAFLLVGFALYQAVYYFFPHLRLDFATFKPAGEVKNAELVIQTYELGLPFGKVDSLVFPKVTLQFNLGNGARVFQKEAGSFAYDCGKEFAATCQVERTKNGQQYVLAVKSYDAPPTATTEWAKFERQGTLVQITRDTTSDKLTTKQAWDELIDSFTPAPFNGVPVRRIHQGG